MTKWDYLIEAGPDKRLRELERAAASGDEDAEDALAAYRLRIGQLPFLQYMERIRTPAVRQFHLIRFGSSPGAHISVQAGGGAYSTPRMQILPADQYSDFEVSVSPLIYTRPSFPHAREFYGGEEDIATYMPASQVQDIFAWMVRTFGAPRIVRRPH